jgi:hypothetical protein
VITFLPLLSERVQLGTVRGRLVGSRLPDCERSSTSVLPLALLPAAGGLLLLASADSSGWPSWARGLSRLAHLAPSGSPGYASRDLRG